MDRLAPWLRTPLPSPLERFPLHSVLFYEEGAFPDAAVTDFLLRGLQANESLLLIVVPEHAALLEHDLAERGAPIEDLVRSGRLLVRDARATLDRVMKGSLPAPGRFAAILGGAVAEAAEASPSRRVRAYGEGVALLAHEHQIDACVAFEHLWSELCAVQALHLCCAYPMHLFGHEALAQPFRALCDAHDDVHAVATGSDFPPRSGRVVAVLQQQIHALQEALHQKDETDRRKDEFLAMLGHELRNPLAPILNALHLMEMRGDPLAARERGIIRRQTEHLRHLVDELLDLSRVTRGTITLCKEPLELAAVVAPAVEMVMPLVQQRRHALTVAVPTSGLRVLGDPFRLAQIFSNLLNNAAKYTDPGGRIRVAARREGESIVVEVSDNGVGIREEMLSRVFELFVQGEHSRRSLLGGLGLGLSMVKTLAELHGGSVSASSPGPGRGCTFTVRLPAAPR